MTEKFPYSLNLFLEGREKVLHPKLPNLPDVSVDFKKLPFVYPLRQEENTTKYSANHLVVSDCPKERETNGCDKKSLKFTSLTYSEFWSQCLPMGEVTGIKILTSPRAKKTKILITLQCNEIGVEPGDSFCILAPNPSSDLQLIESKFPPASHNIPIKIVGSREDSLFLYDFVKFQSDLRAIPKKSHLRFLADKSANIIQQEYLYYLCSSQGTAEYNRLRGENCSFLDYLRCFDFSCDLADIVQTIPLLRGRFYSIANSQHSTPGKISFCFSVLPGGLSTEWLRERKIGDKIALSMNGHDGQLKIQTFRLPPAENLKNIPLIMIGPGTGVSPFIGFLDHFQSTGLLPKQSWLFFGCRSAGDDFIFQAELEEFSRNAILTKLFVAFSSTKSPSNAGYVQDCILKCKIQLAELILKENAIIYVCGDGGQMAKDVMATIESILPVENAKNYILEMIKNKRYRQDIW